MLAPIRLEAGGAVADQSVRSLIGSLATSRLFPPLPSVPDVRGSARKPATRCRIPVASSGRVIRVRLGAAARLPFGAGPLSPSLEGR